MINKVHKCFKDHPIYTPFKRWSYLFVVIGLLVALDLIFAIIGLDYRPYGSIIASVTPDIITTPNAKSLMPVVTEGNYGLSMIITTIFLAVGYGSLGPFLIFVNCFYNTIRNKG